MISYLSFGFARVRINMIQIGSTCNYMSKQSPHGVTRRAAEIPIPWKDIMSEDGLYWFEYLSKAHKM